MKGVNLTLQVKISQPTHPLEELLHQMPYSLFALGEVGGGGGGGNVTLA